MSGGLRNIRSVLIANRGEVAVRVAATCREMGLRCIVVFTKADEGAPFTRAGDTAVPLGDDRNYINIAAIIAAAKASGADAIHPGYGFLAESAPFAAAVVDAGLIFIGPTAETIASLGSKIGAKRLLSERAPHIPLIPGFYPEKDAALRMSGDEWLQRAADVGYPVLIKAAAGGGGKGMRVVRDPKDFLQSLDSAKNEARSAFGDEAVLLERYVERVRHIEVQILGDHFGEVDHLGERECSVQRRHQKLLEESPSPGISENTRSLICGAAVDVGRCVGYQGAGTVEFIVETASGDSISPRFYFLEVNTRLQVEHAVTEQCRGVDIVKMQILIASRMALAAAAAASVRPRPGIALAAPTPGAPLSALPAQGCSMEARVYAEDDAFMPCVGEVIAWQLPEGFAQYHSATAVGSKLGVQYDGLIVKVIVFAPEGRDAARRKLITALQQLVCFGVYTNRRSLLNLLSHPAVASGDMTTDMIDQGRITDQDLQAPLRGSLRAYGSLSIYAQAAKIIDAVVKAGQMAQRQQWRIVPTRWSNNTANKAVVVQHEFHPLPCGSVPGPKLRILHRVLGHGDDTIEVLGEGNIRESFVGGGEAELRHISGVVFEAKLSLNGPTERVAVIIDRNPRSMQPQIAMLPEPSKIGAVCHVQFLECGNVVALGLLRRHGEGAVTMPPSGEDALPSAYTNSNSAGPAKPGEVRSAIPATVVKIAAPNGSVVRKGDVVVVLESMKMERKMVAPANGVVVLSLRPGDLVNAGGTVFTIQDEKPTAS